MGSALEHQRYARILGLLAMKNGKRDGDVEWWYRRSSVMPVVVAVVVVVGAASDVHCRTK